MFVAGFIFGFTAGIFCVGLFAPWLVADTRDELERLQDEVTNDEG